MTPSLLWNIAFEEISLSVHCLLVILLVLSDTNQSLTNETVSNKKHRLIYNKNIEIYHFF